jgi:hypothetical protein
MWMEVDAPPPRYPGAFFSRHQHQHHTTPAPLDATLATKKRTRAQATADDDDDDDVADDKHAAVTSEITTATVATVDPKGEVQTEATAQ